MENDHISRAAKSSEKNHWDAGMRASMQVCLFDFWDILEFIWGYEINKKANEADQIIIKKDDDAKIDDVVAEFFTRLNVIEFKSPGDRLGVPDMRTAVRDALAPFLAPGVKQELLDAIVHTYFKANKALFEEGDPMFEWLEPVYKPKMDRIAAESIAIGRSEGIALGEARGTLNTLFGLVRDDLLSAQTAADRANLSLAAFNAKMAEYETRQQE